MSRVSQELDKLSMSMFYAFDVPLERHSSAFQRHRKCLNRSCRWVAFAHKKSITRQTMPGWLMVALQWIMWQIMFFYETLSCFRVDSANAIFCRETIDLSKAEGGDWVRCRFEIRQQDKKSQINALATSWGLLCGENGIEFFSCFWDYRSTSFNLSLSVEVIYVKWFDL